MANLFCLMFLNPGVSLLQGSVKVDWGTYFLLSFPCCQWWKTLCKSGKRLRSTLLSFNTIGFHIVWQSFGFLSVYFLPLIQAKSFAGKAKVVFQIVFPSFFYFIKNGEFLFKTLICQAIILLFIIKETERLGIKRPPLFANLLKKGMIGKKKVKIWSKLEDTFHLLLPFKNVMNFRENFMLIICIFKSFNRARKKIIM